MIGQLRLALAMIVAAFHLGWMPFGRSPGVTAVIVFYVISGHAMTGLVRSHFLPLSWAKVAWFYRDRLLRLAPQYYAFTGISILCMEAGWRFSDLQSGRPNLLSAIAVVLVLPFQLTMYLPSAAHYMPIPQAWTLSVELLFYAAAPLLICSRRARWAGLWLSIVTLSLATAGIIDFDVFAYRSPLGTLLFFLLGYAIFCRDVPMLGVILGFLGVLLAAWPMALHTLDVYSLDEIIGGLLAALLVNLSTRVRPSAFDRACGGASYGCYLSHWLFMPLLVPHAGAWWNYIAICVLSGLTGWFSNALIDDPIARLRRRLRSRRGGPTN
jgi:peptidoglycan/LPS O-acetylase OafA/YrhL